MNRFTVKDIFFSFHPGKALTILCTLAFVSIYGCKLSTYDMGEKGGWNFPDGSTIDADLVDGNNDIDVYDDCEGADLMNDPENCGECNNVCDFDNAFASCVNGECVMGNCLPGYWDLNEDPSDGCEYHCLPTNNGVEICDGRDNNCNGITDEGFDLLNDPKHCGGCYNTCVFFRAEGSCVEGECILDYCHSGFVDKDGDPANGCECVIHADEDPNGAECEPTERDPCSEGEVCIDTLQDNIHRCSPIPPDLCNGIDTNCNGLTDEDAPTGEPCYTQPTGCSYDEGTDTWTCLGECTTGAMECIDGVMQCSGEKGPGIEICDGLDNNCNGETDEGFDLQNDLLNCGTCGHSCFDATPDNAYAMECIEGVCVFFCLPGFHDLNGDLQLGLLGDGCEYPCEPTAPPGVEYCDGQDNNCDGQIDTPEHLVPPPEGYCRTDPGTPCEGTEAFCTDGILGITWYCNYAPGVETDPANPNRVLTTETLCNDIDGNCSTVVDEPFLLKGKPCDDGGIGACRGTGHYVCDETMTGTICEITEPGKDPEPEVCDGQDNDCNGIIDDNAVDTMVHVVTGDLDFWIDAYEASRPDATADSVGMMDHRACSNPDVIPWHLVTWDEAFEACGAAGKRLCTEEEWQAACEGPLGSLYPYGDTYEPEWCNSADYDHDCTPPNDNILLPTGTPYGCPPPGDSFCISDFSAFDMSGNVMEWTATQVSESPLYYRIRGGSYNNIEPALTCSFDFVSAEPEFYYYDLGFRCCADIPPWED